LKSIPGLLKRLQIWALVPIHNITAKNKKRKIWLLDVCTLHSLKKREGFWPIVDGIMKNGEGEGDTNETIFNNECMWPMHVTFYSSKAF
jgi:hypothetical protein